MHIICHHEGKYNLYSTIIDKFLFDESIDLKQLVSYTKTEYGNRGLIELPDKLIRASENGHSGFSSMHERDLDGLLCCNRCGENEEFMKTEDIIKKFLS